MAAYNRRIGSTHRPVTAPQAGKPHSQPLGGGSAGAIGAEQALSTVSPANPMALDTGSGSGCPRSPRLDARLRAAADWVTPCGICADIGCDHGLLGATLLLEHRCEHLLAADVSAKALGKARSCMDSLHLSAQVTFAVADGLEALSALPDGRADTVCILGMGGETLAGILRRGGHSLQGAQLILGAQTELPLVREALCSLGYRLTAERVVKAEQHLYLLMTAQPDTGDTLPYTERELLLGPCLLQTLPQEWAPWLLRRQRLLTQAIDAMQHSAKAETRLPLLTRELLYTQDALANLAQQSQ